MQTATLTFSIEVMITEYAIVIGALFDVDVDACKSTDQKETRTKSPGLILQKNDLETVKKKLSIPKQGGPFSQPDYDSHLHFHLVIPLVFFRDCDFLIYHQKS